MTDPKPIGLLQVSQSQFSDEGFAHRGNYDLAIAVASWEARCSATAKMISSAGAPVHVIEFASQSEAVSQKKEVAVSLWREAAGDKFRHFPLESSLNFEKNKGELTSFFERLFREQSRPLRVLMDISCLPKRYLLYVLGLGFKGGMFGALDILYSEGKYEVSDPSKTPPSVRRGLVSEGEWSSVQVPYLESCNYVPSQRDLCLGIGAEISVAMPLVERIDPKRMRLFEISDSSLRVPTTILNIEAKAIDVLMTFPSASRISFAPNDALGVASDVLRFTERSTTCLAIGSKPHAVGFALASLADERIEVVCRAPRAYTFGEVHPTGTFYRYVIEDRFDVCPYLAPSTGRAPFEAAPVAESQSKSTAKRKRKPRNINLD